VKQDHATLEKHGSMIGSFDTAPVKKGPGIAGVFLV
jgi:hypothetical protein